MYCKYCGKQIDDDSKFCKECGKNLVKDISNSYYPFSISNIKPFIIPISIILIWYALTFVFIFGVYDYVYANEGINPIGMLVLLWITPIVYYLAYTLINKYSKYPLKLWNETDKLKTKLFKLAYIIYSYFTPLVCSDKYIEEYLGLMFVSWFIPSFLIYLIYYFKSSKSH